MNDHKLPEAEEPTGVRRVGRKDRKTRLTSSGELFPAEEMTDVPVQPEIRQTVVTPPEERFPPIPPQRVRRDTEKNLRPRGAAEPMAQKRKRRAARQNRIALLFFVATIAVTAYFIHLWQNPYSALNPLAPVRDVIYVTATPSDGYAFGLADVVRYEDTNATCEKMTISGAITARSGEGYAVRASSAAVDEGVLPIAENGRFLYQIRVPREGERYLIQLFDTAGNLLAEVVEVQVSAGCAAVVNFEPKG
jgi:hypothetical protein